MKVLEKGTSERKGQGLKPSLMYMCARACFTVYKFLCIFTKWTVKWIPRILADCALWICWLSAYAYFYKAGFSCLVCIRTEYRSNLYTAAGMSYEPLPQTSSKSQKRWHLLVRYRSWLNQTDRAFWITVFSLQSKWLSESQGNIV